MDTIIAIDPGTTESAYVVYDGQQIIDKGKVSNDEILETLYTVNNYGLQLETPVLVAIEMVASYGMPVGKDVFETCLWIGRFIECCECCSFDWEQVYRKDVKLWHCHNLRAKDSNVRQSLIDKYGEPGTKKRGFNPVYNDEHSKMKSDIWSAFAIATYYIEKEQCRIIPKRQQEKG